jgi:cell division septation protein DedD
MSKSSNNISKWIGACLLVIVIGGGIGYYFSGNNKNDAGQTKNDQTTNTTSQGDPSSAPVSQVAGDYTAPGAPKIQISEENVDLSQKSGFASIATPDSSSNSLNPNGTTVAPNGQPSTQPTPNSGLDNSTGNQATPSTLNDNAAGDNADDHNVTPQQPSSPLSDGAGHPDSFHHSGDGVTSDGNSASAPSDKSVYKVVVGSSYANQKSAMVTVADLRHRGYMATASPHSSKGNVSYRVQVGAFHNRVSAEDLAGQLEQSGYAARVVSSSK